MDKDKKILFTISMFLFVALFSLSTFLVSYNSKKLIGNVLVQDESNEIKYIEKEHDLSFESSVDNYFTATDYSEVVDVEDGYVILYNSLRKLVKYDFKGNLVWYVSIPYMQEKNLIKDEKIIYDNIEHFTVSSDKNSFVLSGNYSYNRYWKDYKYYSPDYYSYIYEISINQNKVDNQTKEFVLSDEDIVFSQNIRSDIFKSVTTKLVRNNSEILLSINDSNKLIFYKYKFVTKELFQVAFDDGVSIIPIGQLKDYVLKWFDPVLDSDGNIIVVADQKKRKDKSGNLESTFRTFKISALDGSTSSPEFYYNVKDLNNDFNKEQYIVKDFYLDNNDNVIVLLSSDEKLEFTESLKSKIVEITSEQLVIENDGASGTRFPNKEIVINEESNIYNNIFETKDNCFITTGYYYTDKENKKYSFIFSKYDNSGKLLWSKIDKEEENIKGKISSTFLSKNERIIFVGNYSDVKKFFVTYANDYNITIKTKDGVEEGIVIPSKNTGKVDDIIGLSFNTSSSNDVVNIIFINAYNDEDADIDYNIDDDSFIMPSYDIIIEPVVVEKTTSPTVKPTISSATTSKTTRTSSVKTTNKITNNITQNTSVSSSSVTTTTTTTKTTIYDVSTSMKKEDNNDEKVTTSIQTTKVNSVKKDNKNYTNVVIYMLVGLFGIVIITTICLYIKYKK